MAGKPPDLKLKQNGQPLPISTRESNTMLSIFNIQCDIWMWCCLGLNSPAEPQMYKRMKLQDFGLKWA
jgi:hypothetical protein